MVKLVVEHIADELAWMIGIGMHAPHNLDCCAKNETKWHTGYEYCFNCFWVVLVLYVNICYAKMLAYLKENESNRGIL